MLQQLGMLAIKTHQLLGRQARPHSAARADEAAPGVAGVADADVERKALDLDEGRRLQVLEGLPVDSHASRVPPLRAVTEDQLLRRRGDVSLKGQVSLIDDRQSSAWLEDAADLARRQAAIEPVPALSGSDGVTTRISEWQLFRVCHHSRGARRVPQQRPTRVAL